MVRIISLDRYLEDQLGRDEVADGLFFTEEPSYPKRRRLKIERSEAEPAPPTKPEQVAIGRSLLHPRE